MSREPDLTDPENPEWTEADFAKAKGPESLPAHVLAAFPRTRVGRPKDPNAKVLVSLRLSPDVLAHYKAMGEGWQAKVNEVLRLSMGPKSRESTAAGSVPLGAPRTAPGSRLKKR
jgi:uncharacterized protein (DUF4415 family)